MPDSRPMNEPPLFEFKGATYPSYLKNGNATRFIEPVAKQFCIGIGLDVCSGDWPLKGAHPIDLKRGTDAMSLPEGLWDYVFSSHGIEHLANPIAALEHWLTRIRPGGVLMVYAPHPDQRYWRPQFCRKHLHSWWPADMAEIFRDLGLLNVLHSERDLAWSFAVVGWKP